MPKKEDNNLWIIVFGTAMLLYTIYFHWSVDQYQYSIKGYFEHKTGLGKNRIVNLPLHLLDKNFGKLTALIVYYVISVVALSYVIINYFRKK
jgi:hypothetical protein